MLLYSRLYRSALEWPACLNSPMQHPSVGCWLNSSLCFSEIISWVLDIFCSSPPSPTVPFHSLSKEICGWVEEPVSTALCFCPACSTFGRHEVLLESYVRHTNYSIYAASLCWLLAPFKFVLLWDWLWRDPTYPPVPTVLMAKEICGCVEETVGTSLCLCLSCSTLCGSGSCYYGWLFNSLRRGCSLSDLWINYVL